MSMQCRRCPNQIQAGQLAHIVGHVIVCDDCKEGYEVGYREKMEIYVPQLADPDTVPELTPRRLQLLILADAGQVTKRAHDVSAYDPDTGRTINSKGLVALLRDAGLVEWEKILNAQRGAPTWKLKLTPLGEKTLREARYTVKGQHSG